MFGDRSKVQRKAGFGVIDSDGVAFMVSGRVGEYIIDRKQAFELSLETWRILRGEGKERWGYS